jgi:F-type H+-transporting ATPase subunit a
MPEHTSFFTYLIAMFPALGENMSAFGTSAFGAPVTYHSAEPIVASAFLMLLLIGIAAGVRSQIVVNDAAIIPDARLTWRTFFEIYVGYWYDMMKEMMGPKRAKRYFPLVGSLSCFILFANAIGLIPGFIPPTSSWNLTTACALIVFFWFNYHGIRQNGLGYFRHMAGPYIGWWAIPINVLLFVIELISLLIRPFTLGIRLMLNMSVDHLLVTVILGLVALLLPVPIMLLGTLIVVIQVMVFCLLTCVYISMATEHEEHAH